MEHTGNTRAKRFSRHIPTPPERVLLPRAFSLRSIWPKQLTQPCRRRSLGSLISREWAGWSRSSVAASCHLMIHCPHTLSHTLSLCLPAGSWVKKLLHLLQSAKKWRHFFENVPSNCKKKKNKKKYLPKWHFTTVHIHHLQDRAEVTADLRQWCSLSGRPRYLASTSDLQLPMHCCVDWHIFSRIYILKWHLWCCHYHVSVNTAFKFLSFLCSLAENLHVEGQNTYCVVVKLTNHYNG